jgi:Spy/CpxP family protein refolding chaperone
MKKILVGMFLGLLSVIFLSHNSYAETCSPIGETGRGCRDEGMHMAPPPMRPPVMNIMEEIPGAEHLMWEHLTGLGLDDKQREAIKEIKSRAIKVAIRKRADERIAGIELKDLLDKDPIDMKAVEAKLKQIEIIKTEMHIALIMATEDVKSKLAPEQRKIFKEILEMKPAYRSSHDGRTDTRWCHENDASAPKEEIKQALERHRNISETEDLKD